MCRQRWPCRGCQWVYIVEHRVCLAITHEEIFGPVQQLIMFKNLHEVIKRTSNSDNGLVIAVFSKYVDKVNYIVQVLLASYVWLNVFSDRLPLGSLKMYDNGHENGDYGFQRSIL